MYPLFTNERDWYEYHYGSPSDGMTEMQRLYELGKQEVARQEDDRMLIRQLREMGLWVLVDLTTRYCPYTDAILSGNGVWLREASDDPYELRGMQEAISEELWQAEIDSSLLPPFGHRDRCQPGLDLLYYAEQLSEDEIPF